MNAFCESPVQPLASKLPPMNMFVFSNIQPVLMDSFLAAQIPDHRDGIKVLGRLCGGLLRSIQDSRT